MAKKSKKKKKSGFATVIIIILILAIAAVVIYCYYPQLIPAAVMEKLPDMKDEAAALVKAVNGCRRTLTKSFNKFSVWVTKLIEKIF